MNQIDIYESEIRKLEPVQAGPAVDIQASIARGLQAALETKEDAEKPTERLTSKQILDQFTELELDINDARYKELLNAFGIAKAREEEEQEAKLKQEEENLQAINDIQESGESPEGLLIPIAANDIINKVSAAEKLSNDKATYELEKRLLALQGRNIELETQRKYVESLEEKETKEKYKLAQKINTNKGAKGTLIGNTLSGFFELNKKNELSKVTIENIQTFLKSVKTFNSKQEGKVFDYDSFVKWAPDVRTKVIKVYIMALILNQISTIKGLKTVNIEPADLSTATFAFEFPFNASMRPIFDKITALLFETVAMQKIVKNIDKLNVEFNKKYSPVV